MLYLYQNMSAYTYLYIIFRKNMKIEKDFNVQKYQFLKQNHSIPHLKMPKFYQNNMQ